MSKSQPGTSRRLLHGALRAAEIGDRWFVGLAQGLGRLGGLGSVRAGNSELAGARRIVDEANEAGAPKSASRRASSNDSSRPVPQPAREQAEPALELLSACPAAPPEDRDAALENRGGEREIKALSGGENVPGVRPLVEALGRVVEEHAPRRFVTLPDDPRLWKLVDVLYALGPDQRACQSAAGMANARVELPAEGRLDRHSGARPARPDSGPRAGSRTGRTAGADAGPRKERRCTRFGS